MVDSLREDRRTPLHSWRSQMCRELLRILAASVRILPKPWSLLPESCPPNAIALAEHNAKKLSKNHAKMVPKPPKSIKVVKKTLRSKKVAPKSGKETKKPPKNIFETPPWAPQISQNRKKRGLENRCFFRPPPGTDFASF